MLGGFSFKGIHSSTYGVKETPSKRILSPLKRRNLIIIPGRSEAFVEEDGGYEARIESMLCSYVAPPGASLHHEMRKIAGWLDGVGELTFDYEPDLHYRAYVSSPPPTMAQLEYATFDIEFTMPQPFAYESAIQHDQVVGRSNLNNTVTLVTEGTVKTPIRIVIRNKNAVALTNIKIYHRYVES